MGRQLQREGRDVHNAVHEIVFIVHIACLTGEEFDSICFACSGRRCFSYKEIIGNIFKCMNGCPSGSSTHLPVK